MAAELTVQMEPFGPDQSVHEGVATALVARGALKGDLAGAEQRLLALQLVEPTRKSARPRQPDRYRATFYD